MQSWDALRRGRFGVLEPPAGAVVRPQAGDVVVVPGVAFDRDGGRLGRGRGYYDRAFPVGAEEAPRLVGFAYSVQLVERVPCDSRDRRMDAIVTEDGVHRVTSRT